jgi:4'-phosphopantetheinyl transferase
MKKIFDAALPDLQWGRSAGDHVWVIVADSREWSSWHDQSLGMLDSAERDRVDRMRNQAAGATLVIAYALHRLFLGRFLGVEPVEVPLWRDSLGCPRVGQGLAATSLSHAGSLIAIAVGHYRPLGVDIEPATRVEEMSGLAENICHPTELETLQRLAGPEQARALLSLWTGKEAVLKALGIGFSRGEMNEIALPADGRNYVDQTGEVLQVKRLDRSPSWFAAVACAPVDVVHSFRLLPGSA